MPTIPIPLAPRGGPPPKGIPIPLAPKNSNPKIVELLSQAISNPVLNARRFEPRVTPVPFSQAKRRPYNAAVAGRPSIELSQLGQSANIPENQQWVTGARQKRANIMQSLQRAMIMPSTTNWSTPGVAQTLGNVKGGGSDFNRFAAAIKGKESGGNYGAVNRSSGALGAYQIMPGNIGPWSREILGRSVSKSEFLRNPQIQDAVALGKLRQYYNKYGAAGAATAWYAGPGAVSSKMGSTRSQGQYPSIQSYWQSILRTM